MNNLSDSLPISPEAQLSAAQYPSLLLPTLPVQGPPAFFFSQPESQNAEKKLSQQHNEGKKKNKKRGSRKMIYDPKVNHCYNKYIPILQKMLLSKLSDEAKQQLQVQYFKYKKNKAYYFILLAFMKWCLPVDQIRQLYHGFCTELEEKMLQFKNEIIMSDNSNFIIFRKEEILKIRFAIRAIYLFLRGQVEDAVSMLFLNNDSIITNQDMLLKPVKNITRVTNALQAKYKQKMLLKVKQLRLEPVHQWKKADVDKYLNIDSSSLNPFDCNFYTPAFSPHSKQLNNVPFKEAKIEEGQPPYKLNQHPIKSQKNYNYCLEQYFDLSKEGVSGIKTEDLGTESLKTYPLIILENSYPKMSLETWQALCLQRLKEIQVDQKQIQQADKNQIKEQFLM